MNSPVAGAQPRSCPRTGRTRSLAPAPGFTRPSDVLITFLAAGVAWLAAAGIAAVIAAVTGADDARWLALHFAFVGGISQLIVGAAQFFACAFLATSPPSRRTVRTELLLWNAATVTVGIGVPLSLVALTGIGGTLLLAGLAVFASSLRGMRQRSLQHRPWATRWYLTAAAFLAGGAVLGPLMAAETTWTRGSLLGAHLALNLGGWFGTTIIGTLHTFYPSLTGTQLKQPRLQAPTFAAWTAGVAALALSAALNVDAGGVIGWALLLAASLMLAVNLIGSARYATTRNPALFVVSAGQFLLVGALLLGLRSALGDGPLAALVGAQRAAPALLFITGWIGLTADSTGRGITPAPPPAHGPRPKPGSAGRRLATHVRHTRRSQRRGPWSAPDGFHRAGPHPSDRARASHPRLRGACHPDPSARSPCGARRAAAHLTNPDALKS